MKVHADSIYFQAITFCSQKFYFYHKHTSMGLKVGFQTVSKQNSGIEITIEIATIFQTLKKLDTA